MTRRIEGETIVLDGKVIKDTEFVGCLLIYKGGSVPVLRNNIFDGCTFNFEDSARNTVDFLRNMIYGTSDSSGKDFVIGNLFGVNQDESKPG